MDADGKRNAESFLLLYQTDFRHLVSREMIKGEKIMHKGGRGKQVIALAVFIAAIFSVTPAYSNLTSTFDSDAEGWTVTGGATGFTYQSAGGNPGGYIKASDDTNAGWYFIAPSSWASNWSGYIGGSLQFDLLRTVDTGAMTVNNVRIYSVSNFVAWDVSINPPLGDWTHYAVNITSANFDRIVGTGATFEGIMSNVTALYIQGEFAGAGITGLDNVQINAVPIPAAVWLLGSGLVGLVAIRRRMKK
jgi:hypothetical protein